MNKTVKICRSDTIKEDHSWALKLDFAQRLDIATKLVRDLWCASHGEPFPAMQRTYARFATR